MNAGILGSMIVVTILAAGYAAAEDPWDPATSAPAPDSTAAQQVQPPSKQSVPAGTLDDLRRKLDEAYKAHTEEATAHTADLYLESVGRIAECKLLVEKKPKAPATSRAVGACSLTVTAALLQLKAEANKRAAAVIDAEKDSLLLELNNLHETINGIERSHASKLKEDLDEERRKARQLQEEAERKFSELQSELINVRKDARGTIISMSDILFDIGKASLTSDLKTSLAKIAGILMVYKGANVLVEGHTDNVGSEQYNQELSEQRAGNVMNYLVEQGVAAQRLQAMGYAFHKPIADNETKEGRQKNRRVDLVIQDGRLRQ